MGNHAEPKKSSRHQTPKSLKPNDQSYTDQHGRTNENRNDGHLAALKFSGNHQRQLGKKNATEAEDLVKYMSTIPCYLLHTQKEDNIQAKALNFGVLNWGHLERWKYQQERATVGRAEVDSPSSSDSSLSSFSTFGSSTVSGRSDHDTCSVTQRKQFPSSNFHFNSSNEEVHSQALDEKPSERNVASNVLRTVPIKDQSTGKDSSGLILEKEKHKESVSNLILHRTSQTPELGTSYLNPTVDATERVKAPDGESTASDDNRPTEVNRKCFTKDFRFEFAPSSLDVPHSSPLPCSSSQSNEWSDNKIGGPVDAQGIEIPSNLGRSIPNSDQTPTIKSKGKHSTRHCASTSLDITQRDKGKACSRAKSSPLRRILDPLLKHKVSSSLHFAEACESIRTHKPPLHDVPASTRGADNSSKAKSNLFINEPVKRNQSSFSLDKLGSPQDDKPTSSSMHALLQLGCKDGLPLFTFTYNDTEILAATMRKVYIPGKDDFDCIYTFYSVHVVKKKTEGVMNQGSNSRRQEYHSNIIGLMKATSYPKLTGRESEDHVIMREFVLSSAEQTYVADKTSDFPPHCELAAIVVEVPNEKVDCLNGGDQNGIDSRKSDVGLNKCSPLEENSCYRADNLPPIGPSVESRRLPSIVAILPSSVHSLPGADEVSSSLIDQWKSGGSCDCGGWDVGCTLTILTDQNWPSKTLSSCQAHSTSNNTHQVDLFIQGAAQENRHVFSLVAIKEGLYMVDFNESISLLQTFSICIAILHDRKPAKQSKFRSPLDDRTKTPTRAHGETPLSYVPDPPLSPVGRV